MDVHSFSHHESMDRISHAWGEDSGTQVSVEPTTLTPLERLKTCFIDGAAKAGMILKKSSMAWKGLPLLLPVSKVQLHNYPDGVVFPGAGPQGGSKGKGIAGLKLADVTALLEAFDGPDCPEFRKAKTKEHKGKHHSAVSSSQQNH